MKMKALCRLSICILGFCLLQGCFDDPTSSSSPSANSITGTLVNEDGTAGNGATVRLLKASHVPATAKTGKVLALHADTTATVDASGTYEIPLPDSGMYNVLGEDANGKSVFIDSILVQDTNTVTVPPDTLRVAGSVNGISLLVGQNHTNQIRVTIYMPGTDLLTKPDIGGMFSFPKVPQGMYRLIFDPTMDDYFVKIININAVAGSTMVLDTVIIYSTSITGQPTCDAGADTTVSVGDTIHFKGTANDGYGQIIKYEWDFDGGGTSHDYVTTSSSDTSIVASVVDVSAYLRVTDTDGNTDVDSVRISRRADPGGAVFLQIDPISGYEHIVDAITQASPIIATIKVQIDSLTDTTDYWSNVVLDYGDGSKTKSWQAPILPMDSLISVNHWWARSGTCTTSVTATTANGERSDTSVVVNILRQGHY